jgi:hypothetical protein
MVQQTYYEMIATDKWLIISESVAVTQIDIQPTREEPDQHVVHMAHRVPHTTTVREVPTKSKSGLCFRDEVLAPSNHLARPSSWVSSFSL